MTPRKQETRVGWPHWKQMKGLTAEEFFILRKLRDPRQVDLRKDAAFRRRIERNLALAASDPPRPVTKGVCAYPLSRWVLWAKKHRLACPAFMLKAVKASAKR